MAKQADSALNGIPIRLKRTNLDINDTSGEVSPQSKIEADGLLQYGEPLFLNSNHSLVIGTGDTTTGKASKLYRFRAVPPEYANQLIFASRLGDNSPQVQLFSEDGTLRFDRIWQLTTKDPDGIPKAGGVAVQAFVNNTSYPWYKLKEDGSPDTENPAAANEFPRAQLVPVANMRADVIPYIGLSLTIAQLKSPATVKALKKSFGNISAVASYDGGIIIYCCNKALSSDVYIDVFGG